MKRALVQLKTGWMNLQGYRNGRQYLPGLSKQKNFMHLIEKVENLIGPFARNVIQRLYPRLIYFSMDVIRSRGGVSIQSDGYLTWRLYSEVGEQEMP
jgi:hypothetical protein